MASITSDHGSTTSDAASNPTNSPSDTNNPNGIDIFTTNGSPPIIVAFLAIGLFMVAMAAVFGWRRVHGNRGLLVHQVRTSRASKKPVVLGEKPELWDMWTRTATSTALEDVRWENIMPFSAVLHRPVKEVSPPEAKKLHSLPAHSPPSGLWAQSIVVLQHYFRSLPPPPPISSEPDEIPPLSSPSESIAPSEDAWMQICVTIAMPSPRNQESHGSPSHNGGSDPLTRAESSMASTSYGLPEQGLSDYCIGSMAVPWCEDG
ncbi:hypothetical protein BJ138DRAFT_1153642 [Hygrophoropsis aurantiaca]|uniref:Uncharacterized protein n=1 Tax=Hygrophoropsis aurantiaca TaxID=72124 RepID=A0ACB8ABM4_9AGAM|nr:hypothetical protein BJ138DRAFT_1153642 [Hygrophoropsis aurantiaca]